MSRRKRFDTFATYNDYADVIKAVEQKYSLKYVVCGNFTEPTVIMYESGLQLPTLVLTQTGQHVLERRYAIYASN
jgi:hypothetical protein